MIYSLEEQWQERFSQTAQAGGHEHEMACWTKEALASDIAYFKRYFADLSKGFSYQAMALDVGCGPGTYSRILAERHFQVSAVDFSPKMIERAKENSPEFKINFAVAGIYALPFKDNFFDLIICFGVFQSLAKEKQAILELKRVLKPEGILMITALNRFSLRNLLKKKRIGLPKIKRHSPFWLKNQLARAGFKKVSLRGIYFTPWDIFNKVFFRLKIYQFFNRFFQVFSPFSHHFFVSCQKS